MKFLFQTIIVIRLFFHFNYECFKLHIARAKKNKKKEEEKRKTKVKQKKRDLKKIKIFCASYEKNKKSLHPFFCVLKLQIVGVMHKFLLSAELYETWAS